MVDTQYEELLEKIMREGAFKGDRTGTGTRSLFGQQLRYDLSAGFPLVTTKKVYFRSVIYELLWFLRGETNIAWLNEHGVHIWDQWADEDGELGPIYGSQWVNWGAPLSGVVGSGINQIAQVIDMLRGDPDSRRAVVSAWNVSDIPSMKLPPCHAMFQFYVANGRLSCHIYQRSCDMFLGVPFNIASYALLTHMVAKQTGNELGELVWTGGDCHVYLNHAAQVYQQIGRRPFSFPEVHLGYQSSIFDYTYEDVMLEDYQHHAAIPAPISV